MAESREPEPSPPPPYHSPPRSSTVAREPAPETAETTIPPSSSNSAVDKTPVDINTFIQKLQAREDDLRRQFPFWDLKPDVSTTPSATPSKRKAAEMDSDSDSDDEDNDADMVAPYDSSKQPRPKLPIYHPGFQATEKLSKEVLQIVGAFLQAAKDGGYKDNEIESLEEEVRKARKPPGEPVVRIAITGDTGTGKSATLNSLLGVDNLTPEGDNGGAVTNVVTEFMKKTSRGTKPIAADVKFFCLELCENLTKKWFDHWYALQLKPEDEIDDHDRARKTAALECLDALFADKVPGPIEKYLAKTKSPKDTTIFNKLLGWAREIHGKFVKDGETSVEFGSHTHVDMREQLRPFRSKAHNAVYQGQQLRTSPWPFVEIIRYYLSNAILEQGNCIADVPGANDANMYRVEMANAYLQTCEFTVVTGEIKRILSDASYRQHYLDAHHRRYHGSVILFSTKSDELNDDGGSNLQLDTEAEEVILPIEERLKALRGEINAIDEKVEHNKKEIKRAQRGEINHYSDEDTGLNTAFRSLQQLKEDNKALKTRKKEIPSLFPPLEKQCRDARVACRNRKVALGLDQNYRNDTGDDGGAKVFCLSNRMFMRYLRGYNQKVPEKTPTMSLESTQVPAACAYLYGIPSQGKTAILEHSVVFTIPALLDLIQMSCSKSTEARVEYVLKIVDRAIENLEVQIDALAACCNETFVKTLCEALSDHDLQDTFDRCATASLADWGNNLAAATHKAVVNKRGSYLQKKKGAARVEFNWNERLLSPVRANIERAFRVVLDEACPAFQASAAQAIKTVFRDLNHTLKGDPQALAGDAYKLCIGNRLKAHEANITHQVEQATRKLLESFNAMKRKATRTNEDDYFYDGMIDIYTGALQAKAQKGKTLVLARHEYLKQHIPGEEGPLRAIFDFTKEDAEETIEEIRNYLRNGVIGVFRDIHNAFTGQKRRKENDTPEGQQFRKDLHMLVNKARDVMQGVVLESLERCKEHK